MKSYLVWLLPVLVGLPLLRGVCAEVDQENWEPNQISALFALDNQQEFTPTLDTLDSVQLWHPGFGMLNPTGYIDGTGRVNIRQGVDGPILAISNPTFIDPMYEGTVGFGFSEPVHLNPGQVYVLEPVRVSGDGAYFAATRRDLGMEYPNGRLYVDGQPVTYDLMFREGLGLELIPEPQPFFLFALGLGVVFGVTAFGRRAQCERMALQ